MITYSIHYDGHKYAVLRSINNIADVVGVYNTRAEAEAECAPRHTYIESVDPDAKPAP